MKRLGNKLATVVEAAGDDNRSSCGCNSVLFIIHGIGTGVVEECAVEMLKNHPRVTKFEQESQMNYGCTIAYIN